MTDELAFCNPKVTCVVECDLDTVWQIIKQWSTFYWLDTVQGQPCHIQLYEGGDNQIGSVRSVEIGESLMFEKLVAMDDETHTLKWRTVGHEDSVTPFKEASYLNSLLTVNIREITHNNHTFCEWSAEFYTEQAFAAEMHSGLETWIVGMLQTLQSHVSRENPTVDTRRHPQSPPKQPQPQDIPDDHFARFADLHISPPGNRQYELPTHESMQYAAAGGMLAPQEPVLRQSGRPMGTTSRQAPTVGTSQPTWQASQVQTHQTHPQRQSRRAPQDLSPESARAVQGWAAQQQAHHRERHRHRSHAIGSVYTPSLVSERSNSMDGLDPAPSRTSHGSMYSTRPFNQQPISQMPHDFQHSHSHSHSHRASQEALYEHMQPTQRMHRNPPIMGRQTAPMGAPPSAFFEEANVYDPRSAQSARARPPSQMRGHRFT